MIEKHTLICLFIKCSRLAVRSCKVLTWVQTQPKPDPKNCLDVIETKYFTDLNNLRKLLKTKFI